MLFHQVLKEFRGRRNWTQRQMAEFLGVSPVTLCRWERKKCRPAQSFERTIKRKIFNYGTIPRKDYNIMARVHPLKWHGGKYYLARWIISHMPPHLHYAEPFFGGGAVLFARNPQRDWLKGDPSWTGAAHQRGCSEVINDINQDLMNFYEVIADSEWFHLFRQQVILQPFSEHIFDRARDILSRPEADKFHRAVAFFQLMRMSRQGLGQDYATFSKHRTRGKINEQVNAYLSTINGLSEVHSRLQTVGISCQPAIDFIKAQDGERTLFYCDPPYVKSTRITSEAYQHEMEDEDHRNLLDTLTSIKGRFLLSGYMNPLYAEYASKNDWICHFFRTPNHASARAVKEIKTECLWSNI